MNLDSHAQRADVASSTEPARPAPAPSGARTPPADARLFVPSEARFLLDASSILASSLDWREAIRKLADLIAPALADWCCVDILEPGKPPRRICGSGGREDREPLLRELEQNFPLDPSSDQPPARAIATGEPVLLEDIGAESLRRFELPPRQMEIAALLGMRAVLSVPITARGRVLGAMTLIHSASATFPDATVVLAHDLGRRAGLSIDNALLYHHAQSASRAKSDFLAIMSHELRTPLNSILGYVDLIHAGIGGPVTEQQRSHLAKIRVSSRHLLQIIDEILTYSRMDAGQETVRVERTGLATLVADVVAVSEPLARERGLRFIVDDVPDGDLLTDPHKVRQILLNLVTNAIKFTDEGWVRLSANVAADACEFVVSDSGRGIAPEDLDRIFEPFWQVEDARTRSRGGTGLGLAVSRRLCRMLGGHLTVSSAPGQGAAFTATIARSVAEHSPSARAN